MQGAVAAVALQAAGVDPFRVLVEDLEDGLPVPGVGGVGHPVPLGRPLVLERGPAYDAVPVRAALHGHAVESTDHGLGTREGPATPA